MAEDDGLLLNLSSHSDGQEGINEGKRDRKSKVKYTLKYYQTRLVDLTV